MKDFRCPECGRGIEGKYAFFSADGDLWCPHQRKWLKSDDLEKVLEEYRKEQAEKHGA